MTAIWKWEVPKETPFKIHMPTGARVLCVQSQGGVPCLWAIVNTEAGLQARWFHQIGTGREVPDEVGRYIGTYQIPPSPSDMDQTIYVFHVFAEED